MMKILHQACAAALFFGLIGVLPVKAAQNTNAPANSGSPARASTVNAGAEQAVTAALNRQSLQKAISQDAAASGDAAAPADAAGNAPATASANPTVAAGPPLAAGGNRRIAGARLRGGAVAGPRVRTPAKGGRRRRNR